MDKYGNKEASDLISMIKVVGPRMACNVIDRAIQVHGGGGVSDDFFLAEAYAPVSYTHLTLPTTERV